LDVQDFISSKSIDCYAPERSLTGTNGEQGNGLVDTAQGRNIDSLATDGTLGTDTGGVFTGTAVDNGITQNLEGVLVGHDSNLKETILEVENGVLWWLGRTISKAWATMRTAITFLPLLRPFIMSELVRRSTMGH
jgi:hypothetical protein